MAIAFGHEILQIDLGKYQNVLLIVQEYEIKGASVDARLPVLSSLALVRFDQTVSCSYL